MSDLLTRVRLPGLKDGCVVSARWGRNTVEVCLASVREHAKTQKARAEEILAARDDEFQVDIVRGSCVQHHVKELQKSSRKV